MASEEAAVFPPHGADDQVAARRGITQAGLLDKTEAAQKSDAADVVRGGRRDDLARAQLAKRIVEDRQQKAARQWPVGRNLAFDRCAVPIAVRRARGQAPIALPADRRHADRVEEPADAVHDPVADMRAGDDHMPFQPGMKTTSVAAHSSDRPFDAERKLTDPQ